MAASTSRLTRIHKSPHRLLFPHLPSSLPARMRRSSLLSSPSFPSFPSSSRSIVLHVDASMHLARCINFVTIVSRVWFTFFNPRIFIPVLRATIMAKCPAFYYGEDLDFFFFFPRNVYFTRFKSAEKNRARLKKIPSRYSFPRIWNDALSKISRD